MKRLLVTGGRGFIGRHCLAPAVTAGFEVWATAARDGEPPADLRNLPIHWRTVDLLQHGAIEALVAEIGPTHVLHTAWETSHGSYWTSPANLSWLALGARFFEAFSKHGGERFVAAGTCAEYEWKQSDIRENVSPERPATLYGRMKLIHHQALMAAAEHLGFSAATGRVFFIYGPHENANRIVPYACKKLARGEPAAFGSGLHLRDFIYVEDVAEGFIRLLCSSNIGAFNICSGTPISLGDLLATIGRISGRPDLILLGTRADRAEDPMILVGDNVVLRSTGWQPKMPIYLGLEKTFQWWKDRVLMGL